jgi:hypothetical protein
MNMLYEGLKEKGAMIIVPSTAVETMSLGAISGLASMGTAQGLIAPVPGVTAPGASDSSGPAGAAGSFGSAGMS